MHCFQLPMFKGDLPLDLRINVKYSTTIYLLELLNNYQEFQSNLFYISPKLQSPLNPSFCVYYVNDNTNVKHTEIVLLQLHILQKLKNKKYILSTPLWIKI